MWLQKKNDKAALLTRFPEKSGYAESYRTMRTNLQFSAMDIELKSICITSATEMEGKTNTVANLAYTMAQTGQRVLMVDCDLRKPGLTRRFGCTNQPGLTGLISQELGRTMPEGRLSDIRLDDLIKLNRLQKKNGILSLTDEHNHVDISLQNGNLVDIFWKNRPEKKKLASTLISNNLLTKEQAQIAIGHQKKSVQKLGTILTTMGMISKADLKKHLSIHIVEAFKTAATMYDGKFIFTPMQGRFLDTTIDHNVNFDRLVKEFINENYHSPYLSNIIETMVCETETENLFLMPSGKIPPNPSNMINSDRMSFVIESLINLFDFVVIDTPPVLPASDALVIAPNTDGILMVVKAGKVSKKHVKNAVSQIETGKTKILGLVLNRVNVNKERYYRYYRKYYTSYYGKSSEE